MRWGWQIHRKVRQVKTAMNLGLAKVARVTHFIPEKPRRAVRDWLIAVTTPGKLRPYRAPIQSGRITQPPGINEYGFFRAQNGLAQGAKLYAQALKESGIPFTLVNTDFIDWLAQDDHSWDSWLTPGGKYAINLIHINPDQLEEACRPFPHREFDDHYNIGVWLWELETLPASWKPKLDYVDELWVPSRFIAEAVRRETDKPVQAIHYGIDTPAEPCSRPDFGLPEEEFLVLAMYDSNSYASRKNPEGAIRAFEKAFGGRDVPARLVLKLANGKEEELRALRERLAGSGIRYQLITERYEKPRLNALIACCDVYLSLHRSEGFGLVVAEAMSLGVPVVATAWSANAEFMPEECTCRVKATLVPVGDAYQWGEEHHRWADPDVDQAAAYLRMLQENPEKGKRMAEEARAWIRKELSPERCGEKMRKRFEEICRELRETGRMSGS